VLNLPRQGGEFLVLPQFGKGLGLVEIAAALACSPVAVDPFLESGVVELALRFGDCAQRLMLFPVRKEAILVGEYHG